MSSCILFAHNLFFSWDEAPVLQEFSLSLERGTVVCLMGVNGCGKTTFLDCVLGQNKPESGFIEVDSKEVSKMSARERAQLISYVPQIHERVFPYTVSHLVLMGRTAYQGTLSSAPSEEDYQRVSEALDMCGITHLANRPCTALSGGEMQMALLARALVQDTPLIVLDEPTAHLDFRNELLFLETVENLVRSQGVSILMATHSPNQAFHFDAAGLKTKVALMEKGAIIAEGSPSEVLTPKLIRQTFGVVVRIVQTPTDHAHDLEEDIYGEMRQIVPVKTAPEISAREDE